MTGDSVKRSTLPWTRALLVAGLGTLLGLSACGCARAGEKPRPKVLLIGVDAADWEVMGPLLDEGKLPNFARLRAEGASGKLRSLEPLTKSPIIWASIATGKVPSKHGISDFFAKQAGAERAKARAAGATDEAPATSNLWRARPIWDIVGSVGKRVGVVGWWTTWPAQPVNGVLVSDYVQYSFGSWPARESRRTYPDSLDAMVAKLRRSPESISWAELFQFVPPIDTTRVTERQEQLIHDLRWMIAGDLTFHRIGLDLYRKHRSDFFAIYFRGIDAASHRYWDIDIPGTFTPPMTDSEYHWLKNLIRNYYIFTDRLIGELLRETDRNTSVVICSDHGFGGGGKGIMAHKLDGILFVKGPGTPKGGNISGATVLDVTPTVLALFGLPTADDMDGRPVEDALSPAVAKRLSREKRLKTYEMARRPGETQQPIASPVDEELRERLRSLGYIQ
jgi:predicted AlkP superfamily phosphohydrolase/phosphomutase